MQKDPLVPPAIGDPEFPSVTSQAVEIGIYAGWIPAGNSRRESNIAIMGITIPFQLPQTWNWDRIPAGIIETDLNELLIQFSHIGKIGEFPGPIQISTALGRFF
jgi:hypothetical protein